MIRVRRPKAMAGSCAYELLLWLLHRSRDPQLRVHGYVLPSKSDTPQPRSWQRQPSPYVC